jgi:hypothetical protein
VAISQNLTFTGASPADVEDHPPGAGVARFLMEAIRRSSGWSSDDLDSWRDVGWSLVCRRASSELQIALTAFGDEAWMLQVAPLRWPGLVGRALGRQPSATPEDCLALALLVHETLAQGGRFGDFRWQWDGPPTSKSGDRPTAPL